MKKRISKKIRAKKYVQPEQLRRTLVVTARECIKTLEYQEKAKKRLEERIKPQLKYFETMAKRINQQMNSLGVPRIMKKIEEQYASILKDYQSPPKEILISPRYNNFLPLSTDLIEIIAEKTTEKIFKKIKEYPQQNKIIKAETAPIKLPEKTIWENIEVRFKNQYDVDIYLKRKFLKTSNYEELGFLRQSTKDKKPDRQWEFLRMLAIIYNNKKLVKATIDIIASALKVKNNACMKIKENTTTKLRKAFGLTQNPFYEYKEKGEYKTCFTLKPESELRGDGELFITKTRYDDNKEYKKHKEYLD